jgi:hypothetical protein
MDVIEFILWAPAFFAMAYPLALDAILFLFVISIILNVYLWRSK